MSCATCQSRVEKAVNALPDVDSAVVSLLTNSMQVEGSASDGEIIQAVEKAGYGAKTAGSSKKDTTSMEEDQLKDTQTPILRKRLIVSLVLLIPLMYISMGHLMWDWPLPSFLIDNHIAMGLIQMLFTIAILVINQKFFISGFKGVLNKAPNMDTLVAMGAGAAFAYSTYVLFAMTDAQVSGNSDKVMEYMHDFYFESAAMIVTLITLGKMLESYSKGKTTDALKSLMKMVPKTATIIEKDLTGNEKEKIVSIEDININDVFVVKPGENIPVDGIVIDGFGAVDESAITGESIPVDKTIGSKVSSAGVNQSGYLKCKATRVGEDCYYEMPISKLTGSIDYSESLVASKDYANKVNLTDMMFRKPTKSVVFDELSKKECKEIEGIPLFADVRGFTSQFDNDDTNLEEMAIKTQNILTTMYDLVTVNHGIHVQFQGDREFALFHNYAGYECLSDAVKAGLKMIDAVQTYGVSIGVGESFGKMFATRIGARGEKDYLLIGTTVIEADRNEDENAKANQLVISNDVYLMLKKDKPKWADIFIKQNGYYYTTTGYNKLMNIISQEQLNINNRNNNYNGAWRE